MHELKEPDYAKRMAYCQWLQTLVQDNLDILDYTWFSDEAWFHLSGYINSQNCRIWASKNLNAIHEEPPYSKKIGVWCGISWRRIIGPIFFDTTITTAAYLDIFHCFVNQLDDEELSIGFSSRMEQQHTPRAQAWPKSSVFLATVSFPGDFGHCARPI